MRGSDRTLLLAPASVAGQEAALRDIYNTFDRSTSDLQMLDRLAAGAVKLPEATYDLVVVLTDPNGARRSEAYQWLTRQLYDSLATSMKDGAILEAQDGPLPATEPTLAGLVKRKDGRFEKAEESAVQIRIGFGKKKKPVTVDLNDYEDGEELVDEDGLLSAEDLSRPYPQPRKLAHFLARPAFPWMLTLVFLQLPNVSPRPASDDGRARTARAVWQSG